MNSEQFDSTVPLVLLSKKCLVRGRCCLVAAEDVAGVYFGFYIVEGGVVAVGDDGLGCFFEFCQVVNYLAAEEGCAVFESGLVDDDACAFGFDALHHALDAALTEIVAVTLHCQAIYTDDTLVLGCFAVAVCGGIVVVSGHFEYLVGDEVFAGAVAFDDCAHHLLWHVGVVGKELLGVFWQAVAAVTE